MALKTYKAKIRLGVQSNDMATTEVWKTGLTKAEIQVLSFIHGPNSVVEITPDGGVAMQEVLDDSGRPAGERARTVPEERERLSMTYSHTSQERPLPGPALVNHVFGPAGMPHPAFDDEPTEEAPKRAPRPTKTIDPSELQSAMS